MKENKSITKTKKSRQTAAKQPVRDVFTVICKTDLKVECVKEFKFHPVRSGGLITLYPNIKSLLKLKEAFGRVGGTLPLKVFSGILRNTILPRLWDGVCSEQRLMTCTRKRPLI